MTETPPSDRDRALQILDQIRSAINADDLQEVAKKTESLHAVLAEWNIANARTRLDTILAADLLLFDVEAARLQLKTWESALKEDDKRDDLDQYQERVAKRITQKQTDLQVRGVTAHCEDLWRSASELEHGDQPPRPEFLLENYYTKARDMATAAHSEYPDDARLDVLVQKAQRLRQNRIMAGKIFQIAIEEDRYADALDDLGKLDAGDLVPRYRAAVDPAADTMAFDGMIPISQARTELQSLGAAWATEQVTQMSAAEDHLAAYQPQVALDALADRQRVDPFVDEETKQKLADLEEQANDALQSLQQAENLAKKAQQQASSDPVAAWNTYVEAYQAYAGAPSLTPAHQAIINAMDARLEQLTSEADTAFNDRDMTRVSQIARSALQDYTDKDSSLDAALERLEELDWQARTYLEYLQTATTMVGELRDLVWQDVNAAAELIAQLDEYPDMVLEEFADLSELRASVRRRLAMDEAYKHLSALMTSGDVAEVEQGIAAAGEYSDDARFPRLVTGLKLHAAYLTARREYTEGHAEQALELLDKVVASEGHVDHPNATRLAQQIRAEMGADETDEPEE